MSVAMVAATEIAHVREVDERLRLQGLGVNLLSGGRPTMPGSHQRLPSKGPSTKVRSPNQQAEPPSMYMN